MRLTLVQKLVTGYAAIALFTMAALVFSVMGLYSLNTTARDIAKNDLVFINSTIKLRESLLAQQRAAVKGALLDSHEFRELYRKRADEFQHLLLILTTSQGPEDIKPVIASYVTFQSAADKLLGGDRNSTETLNAATEQVIQAIDACANFRQLQLSNKLEAADKKQTNTVQWTLILSFTGFLLAIIVATLVTYKISKAFTQLKKATHRIAEGEFDYDPQIPAGDEIGELARDFVKMAGRLKQSEQMCLDASPLTRLPGNIAIERVLTRRLHGPEPFAVCYADLDNLKAYNDHYGYIRASDLIKATGEIIHDAVRDNAGEDAFVGHVGGDDFVMVVTVEEAAGVCEAVIERFGKAIVDYYDAEDLARGAIAAVDRYGVPRVFPIMTISIAVVICGKGEYESAVDIARAAAEMKDYVKGQPGSNYLMNRRRYTR